MMSAFVLLGLLLSCAVVVRAAQTTCAQLFPSTGAFYSEVCMFNTHGLFPATTIGIGDAYILLSHFGDASELDAEEFTLKPLPDSPTHYNASHNCRVTQTWKIWNPSTQQWDEKAPSSKTEVNILGETVYLTPGVVPVNGMCVMERLEGDACVTAANFVLAELQKRNVYYPVRPNIQKACYF